MATKRQKEHKLLVERQQYAKLVKRGKIKSATWRSGAKILADAFGEVTRNISRAFAAIRESLQRKQ
ncbi:MAG: hypothetical protein ACRC9Z_08220 [Weissella confusa]